MQIDMLTLQMEGMCVSVAQDPLQYIVHKR